MELKSKLVFDGSAVLELLTHAKAAPRHTSTDGLTPNPGLGLMLVKDDGIYLMSTGEPHQPGTETLNRVVVYARGYEALPTTASIEERMARTTRSEMLWEEMTSPSSYRRRASPDS